MLIKQMDFGPQYNSRIQGSLGWAKIYTTEAVERADDATLLLLPGFGHSCLRVLRANIPRAEWQVWTPEKQEAEFQREYGL